MSPELENFDGLRRLLALKRYEQPPPGFFDQFSDRVRLGIKTGDRGEEADAMGLVLAEAPWLQRIFNAIATNPALAGAFGLVVCSLMVAGIAYSSSSGAVGAQQTIQELTADTSPGLQIGTAAGFVSSTNGFLPSPAGPSLFDEFRGQQPHPAVVPVSLGGH